MLYVGDADFSTDIMGNSLESNVALDVRYLSLLAIDDVNSHQYDLHEAKGVSYWKVSKSKSLRSILHHADPTLQSFGYALVAEIAGTNTTFNVTKASPVHVDVRFTINLPAYDTDISIVKCGWHSTAFAFGCRHSQFSVSANQ